MVLWGYIGSGSRDRTGEHRIMVLPGISGRLIEIKSGSFTVEETIARVETSDRNQRPYHAQRWPVRRGRPYRENSARKNN